MYTYTDKLGVVHEAFRIMAYAQTGYVLCARINDDFYELEQPLEVASKDVTCLACIYWSEDV